jgi:putative transferase (TIGR04331 family)
MTENHFDLYELKEANDLIELIAEKLLSLSPWNACIQENCGEIPKHDSLLDRSWLYSTLHFYFAQLKSMKSQGACVVQELTEKDMSVPAAVEHLPWWLEEQKTLIKRLRIRIGLTTEHFFEFVVSQFSVALSEKYEGARRRQPLGKMIFDILKILRTECRKLIAMIQLFLIAIKILKLKSFSISIYHLENSKFFRVCLLDRMKGLFPIDDLLPSMQQHAGINVKSRIKLAAIVRQLLVEFEERLSAQCAEEITRLVCIAIPISHFEKRLDNLERISEKVAMLQKRVPLVQLTGLYFETASLFAIALLKAKGSKIIGCQHGGNYGYAAFHSLAQQVEGKACERFLTWGWEQWPADVNQATAVPIPVGSFYLRKISSNSVQRAKKKGSTRSKQISILYCAVGVFETSLRFEPSPSLTEFKFNLWPENLDALIRFCEVNKIDAINIKLYGLKSDSYFKELIKNKVSSSPITVTFINPQIKAIQLFSNYSLVLWDSLCTGFLECLATDTPTLLLPSASRVPRLYESSGLSEKFFIDQHVENLNRPFELFREAKIESHEWIRRFCRTSPRSLVDFFSRNIC